MRKTASTAKKPSLTKKKNKPVLVLPPTPQSTPNPSLPNDLLLSCFARVSRLYYPTLSFVSKSFSSLLTSPELYKTRSSLGNTESCLYVCLSFHRDPNPRWFTLCRRPDRTITTSDVNRKKKSSGYVLAKLPTLYSGPVHRSSLVTLGSNVYNIGGHIDDDDDKEPSSRVLILDSRSNTWVEGPSMLVKRKYPAANVVDGKIYVAGGCKDSSCSSDWMEVFDPKTQTWELVSCPGTGIFGFYDVSTSVGVDGKIYMFGSCDGMGMAYKPREGRWERVGWEMYSGWIWYSHLVIGDVLFFYYEGQFKWYDTKVRSWRILEGVNGLPKFPHNITRLADYGGKMVVLWERVVTSKDKLILCAVIALERRNDEEIWGKVEWYDGVLRVPKSCRVECALATTV